MRTLLFNKREVTGSGSAGGPWKIAGKLRCRLLPFLLLAMWGIMTGCTGGAYGSSLKAADNAGRAYDDSREGADNAGRAYGSSLEGADNAGGAYGSSLEEADAVGGAYGGAADTPDGPKTAGCGADTSAPDGEAEDDAEGLERVEDIYRTANERALQTGGLDGPEGVRYIVESLGDEGWTAVDGRNQIDMTEPGQVERFCRQRDEGREGELTLFVVCDLGGFIRYRMETENGRVDIVRNYYEYDGIQLRRRSSGSYTAELWQYTEDGYLLFRGSFYSEAYYVLLLSNVPEEAALRVQPLDEKCRELNRKYILPVGYRKNNLFLTDWNEEDFGGLDFYDMFDLLYPAVRQRELPYTADGNPGTGRAYRIPGTEFEQVIRAYFRISKEALRSKTDYSPGDRTYEYRPRGFYEEEYPDIPYPEVVGYRENSDGTISLTVNAVYPHEASSRAFVHETVIRPMEDGSFRYVSNRLIEGEDCGFWWHEERLDREAWEEIYARQ